MDKKVKWGIVILVGAGLIGWGIYSRLPKANEELAAADKVMTLTGVDINTSEYRVAEARLKDGTDKDEWTTFELAFEYLPEKSYDSTKEYKLAIICSSSKEGDKFKGAANSTLIVDELEVIGE